MDLTLHKHQGRERGTNGHFQVADLAHRSCGPHLIVDVRSQTKHVLGIGQLLREYNYVKSLGGDRVSPCRSAYLFR